MKQRILFVDDEPAVLAELEAALSPLGEQWELVFVNSGPRALERLVQESFAAVVTDIVMPGMDGVQLLNWVMKRFPQVVRLAMLNNLDTETSKGLLGLAQQFVGKPCQAPAVREALERAFNSRDQCLDPPLKAIVSQVRSLPGVPAIYLDIMQELRAEEPCIPKVAKLISQDLALTAKMLQLVNSAYFGLREHVTGPDRAIYYLGIGALKNIVLAISVYSDFEKAALPGVSVEGLWAHSVKVGALARMIVRTENRMHLSDDAYASGLLHDLGKLVLASGLSEPYGEVLRQAAAQPRLRPLWEIEREILGATHAEVGAYLLGLWGLPAAIVEAVGFHHRPADHPKKDFSMVTAVHVANALAHESDTAVGPAPGTDRVLDLNYLTALGLPERLDVWRQNNPSALAA